MKTNTKYLPIYPSENLLSKYTTIYIYTYIYISKVGNCSRGRPEGFGFNSYYTEL